MKLQCEDIFQAKGPNDHASPETRKIMKTAPKSDRSLAQYDADSSSKTLHARDQSKTPLLTTAKEEVDLAARIKKGDQEAQDAR